MASQKVRNIMTGNPKVVTPESSAQDAARMMQDNDCGSLPVVESSSSMTLIGIVTDRDLAIRVLACGKGATTPVREAMTHSVSSVKVDDELSVIERVMTSQQVRRVPVVDDQGQIVGIVAQADLARVTPGAQDIGRVVEKISQPA